MNCTIRVSPVYVCVGVCARVCVCLVIVPLPCVRSLSGFSGFPRKPVHFPARMSRRVRAFGEFALRIPKILRMTEQKQRILSTVAAVHGTLASLGSPAIVLTRNLAYERSYREINKILIAASIPADLYLHAWA